MAEVFQPEVSLNQAIFNACDALCVMAGTVRPVLGVDPIWQIEKKGCAAVQALQAGGLPDAAIIAAINAEIANLQSVEYIVASANAALPNAKVIASSPTIVFSTAGGSFQGHAVGDALKFNLISAGTRLADTQGTVVFANSNGVSFGMDVNNMVTASFDATQSAQTQNSVAIMGSSGNISFVNSNGITFGGLASSITASHNGLTSQSIQTQGMASVQGSAGNIIFANSNNVSFGFNASTVTASASYSQSTAPAAIVASNVTITNGTVVFTGSNNITVSATGSTVIISGPTTYPETPFAISGGANSQSTGTVNFSDSNGVSFGLAAGVMTATVKTDYLTTAMASNAGSNFVAATAAFAGTNASGTIASNGISVSVNAGGGAAIRGIAANGSTATENTVNFSNSNGISFGYGAAGNSTVITASHNAITSQSVQTQGSVAILGSTGAISFANSNGITFGGNGSTITASHNGLTSQSNQAVSAANGSYAFQTLSFSNANGISFGTSAGSAITASYTVPTQSVQPVAASASNGSFAFSTLGFSNANGVTFGTSAGSIVTASVNAGGGGAAISAGANSQSTGTVNFANSNGITFGLSNNGTMTASHNGITSQTNQTLGLYAVSNTTQSTSGTVDARTLSFHGAGVASVGISNGSVIISVPAGGGGLTNINISAGTTSNNLSNLSFGNANGVTFGLNGSTLTASVNAAGGAGATMSQYPMLPHAWATSSMYSGASATTAGGSASTLSYYFAPLVIPYGVSFNDVLMMIGVQATAAGTGSGTRRHAIGIYTKDANTFRTVTSFAWNAAHSQSSVTAQTLSWWNGPYSYSTAASTSRISGNVSASISGLHQIRMNPTSSATSLAENQYYIAHAYQFRSTGAALFSMGAAWRHSVSQFTGAIGFSNTTGPQLNEWNGIFSTTSTAASQFEWVPPATIHTSVISATGGTSRNQWPLFACGTATA